MAIIDFFMTTRGRIVFGTAIALIALAIILLIINFGASSPSDTWTCKDGQWVKQGNPQGPMPEAGCGEGISN